MSKNIKKKFLCKGGPWYGLRIRLTPAGGFGAASTATFSVGKWHGRYVQKESGNTVEWEDEK